MQQSHDWLGELLPLRQDDAPEDERQTVGQQA